MFALAVSTVVVQGTGIMLFFTTSASDTPLRSILKDRRKKYRYESPRTWRASTG